MKKLFSFLFVLFVVSNLKGQTTFKNTYATNNRSDYGESIVQLDDGGYVICGVQVFQDTMQDFIGQGVIRKIDPQGNELWIKNYSDSSSQYQDLNFHHIIETFDKKLLVVGNSDHGYNNNYNEAFVGKLDLNGSIIWQYTYGGLFSQTIKKVIQTSDGGFIMVGSSNIDNGANSLSIYAVKLSVDGELEWEYTHHNNSNNPIRHQAYSVVENGNNEFIISGKITASITSPAGLYVVKIDSVGNLIWEKTFDYFGGQARDVFVKSNGNIILCGWYAPNWIGVPLIVELSTTGTFVNDYEFNHTDGLKEWAYSFCQDENDNIVMLSFDTNYNYRVTKIDNSFNIEWSSFVLYDQISSAEGNGIERTTDGGFVCTGTSIIQGNIKSTVFKVGDDGFLSSTVLSSASEVFTIYPNPSNDILQIDISDNVKIQKLEIFDIQGKRIKSFNVSNKTLDISGLISGAYFLKISTAAGVLIKNVVVQ